MREPVNASAALDIDPDLEFSQDVAEGLARRPKQLPAKYLYDALGSKLFEAICELPWYNITRGECALLGQHAEAIVSELGDGATLVELGGGNGAKLSLLLSAFDGLGRAVRVHLVDISATALQLSAVRLSRHAGVTVVRHEATYEAGLRAALEHRNATDPVLVMFLGSNIGNLGPEETHSFLTHVRSACRRGDRFLLGADLVKPEADLLLAYDDPLGVTAAFNKNLLARVNRELDGDFDLGRFAHRVLWNGDASRVESYLESQEEQLVCIRGSGCCVLFDQGERIWTESSYKYEPEGIVAIGEGSGFARRAQWIEPQSRFALTLFEAE